MEKLRRRLARRMRALMDADPNVDTQMKVANKSGVGQSSIGRLLASEQSATLDMLEQLAAAFGLAPECLLLEADEVALLKEWNGLANTDKAAVLGYIRIARQTGREQLPLDAHKPLEPGLQAKQKSAAVRVASKTIEPVAHASKAQRRKN